ncbi:MAG: LCP family protein [Candidatus Sericytochromatia bacterium]
MRWLIGTSVVVTSSILGIITAYATADHSKTIVPKPEDNIVGLVDNEDGFINDETNTNVVTEKKDKDLDTENSSPEVKRENSEPIESVEPYTETETKPYRLFLVMGTDVVYSYPGKKTTALNGRTDAIMLVKMTDDKIDLVSIPRDSRVLIPGYGYNKINAANVFGGPELVKRTIDNWLGIHIDDYALVNTFGIVQFVDLFGGVDFNVPKRMKYNDFSAKLFIDIYPGMQHLDGKKVHDFLRFRHDGMGDLNRVARQQEILKAMVPQILKPLNIIKIPKAVRIINSNMETNISTGKFLFLANKALQMTNLKDSISMHTLPGDGKMYKGGWYWFIDEKGANKVLQEVGLRDGGINNSIVSNQKNEITTTEQ